MFSFSQLAQWDKCRYAWHLTYNENLMLAGPKGRPLSFGSLTHELLADFYLTPEIIELQNEFRPVGEDKVYKRGHRELLVEYINNGGDHEVAVSTGKLMDRYVNDFAPFNDKFRVREVEGHFELELVTPKGREFTLQGYVDGLIEMSGELIVLEHKTYNSRPWSPNEIQMDVQTTIYCIAMEKLYGRPVKTAMYNFLNSYPYKNIQNESPDKLFKRVSVFRSPVEQAFVINEVGNTVDQILDAEQQVGVKYHSDIMDLASPFVELNPYKKSLGKACSMCQFQQICLSEMKGIPTDGIKKNLYTERTVTEEVSVEPAEN